MSMPFRPSGSTVSIDVSASSQRVSIADAPTSIRVMNNGSATVWLNFGDATVTAATGTGYPVGPGVTEVVSVSNNAAGAIYFAAIAAGATGRVYCTPGSGI